MASIIALSELELKPGPLADECSEFSVTAVSIVRLTYLIKIDESNARSKYYVNIYIWTNIEVNISIVCGQ